MRIHRWLSLLPFLVFPVRSWAVPPAPARSPTQPHLEHVAVWAADLEKTAAFLQEALGWRLHPLEFGVAEDSAVYGGMKLAFVDANGFWIELVEPTTEGPGMEFLKQKGNGSIVELDFFVDDFDKSVAWMKGKGVEPWGMDGKPMVNGGLLREWARIDGKVRDADERLMYLPMDVSNGTSIELGWEYPSGVVYYRDETWGPDKKTPADAPRMDHVTVAAADLNKTVATYTSVLELRRATGAPGLERRWMGVSESGQTWIHCNSNVWVNIVAPAGSAEIVKRMGEMAKQVGGHGGMDFMMDWRLIDCLRNGLPMDMDVYDAAAWSCITPLSEWSIANGSAPIEIPDFTRGNWQTNKPVEISLKGGGTTQVRNLKKANSEGQMKVN